MNIWIWAGAVSPIVFLFILLSVFRLRTDRAAFLGLLVSVIASIIVGRSDIRIAGIDIAKGAFSTLNILLVIWSAIFLYEVLEHAQIFASVRGMLMAKTKDELMLILLICWLFSSFLQGITGFGVPVAVCAPILAALGVSPLFAVIITLLGHAWANTYGTLALAWDALIAQSETLRVTDTKWVSGGFLWAVNLANALLICWIYGKWKAIRHMLPFILLISLIHGGGQLLVSMIHSTVAAFIPAVAALAAAWGLLGRGYYTKPWKIHEAPFMSRKELPDADRETEGNAGSWGRLLFPFGFLTAVSVLVLMVKPINRILSGFALELSFPSTQTGRGFAVEAAEHYGTIRLFTHAGFVLLLTAVLSYLIYRRAGLLKQESLGPVMRDTLKKVVPASLGVLFLVIMSQVMKGSGLMQMIAVGVTGATGRFYSLAVSFTGLLGAFMTSSNTSSNILLAGFQKTAADLLAIDEAVVLSAQTAGGAIGTVVGPSTILLGTTTAGCQGREGNVLRFMLPIVIVEAALVGCAAWILTIFM